MQKIYNIKNLNETKQLAEAIANNFKIGDIITLRGTLGAGKTYLTSCFINYLLKKEGLKEIDILSPTFNIVKEYQLKNYSIYHFDLYRLKNKNELYELDIETAFENGISIIEWPDIADDIIRNNTLDICIKIINENERIFTILNKN